MPTSQQQNSRPPIWVDSNPRYWDVGKYELLGQRPPQVAPITVRAPRIADPHLMSHLILQPLGSLSMEMNQVF